MFLRQLVRTTATASATTTRPTAPFFAVVLQRSRSSLAHSRGSPTATQGPACVPAQLPPLAVSTSECDDDSTGVAQEVTKEEFDIVIVGGGVVGAALARSLVVAGSSSLQIALVEAGSGPTKGTLNDNVPNPRSYALSPASLNTLGIDDATTTSNERMKGFYQSMQVWEANQPASLLWSSNDLPPPTTPTTNGENTPNNYLGCCIEDAVLTEHLWQDLSTRTNNVTLFRNSQLHNIEWPRSCANGTAEGWVRGALVTTNTNTASSTNYPTTATTSTTTRQIRAHMVVAADGAQSSIRQRAGIPMLTYQYGQTALTCTVQLERSLQGRAYQRVIAADPTTSGGGGGSQQQQQPLALLPTYSDRHAVVVWSTSPAQAAHWQTACPVSLTAHLNELFQTGPEPLAPLLGSRHENDVNNNNSNIGSHVWNNVLYGIDRVVDTIQYGAAMAAQQQIWDDDRGAGQVFTAPPLIAAIASPRYTFPLQCQMPAQQQYVSGTHLALVGDAAHTVHPLAGQGLNLGLQDVAALTAVVHRAATAGMPPGTFLSAYQSGRRQQVGGTVSGIHLLQRLLLGGHGQSAAARHVRSLGMSLLQLVGPARRAVVRAATQGAFGFGNTRT